MKLGGGAIGRLWRCFGRARPAPRAPEGLRLYVVGDIHGRADLLAALHERIRADAASDGSEPGRRVVYLGDYVDRGFDSKGVIDLLLERPLEGFEAVHLKGNHEDALLRFLDDPARGPDWFAIGGDATAMSYGVRLADGGGARERFHAIRDQLRQLLPRSHLAFLSSLHLSHEAGDYLCVHAGIRPGVPLDAQEPDDLMWIREPFLRSGADHGKVVIHGHSPARRPKVRANRIALDTTAYASNVLTCLVLEGTARRFLDTRHLVVSATPPSGHPGRSHDHGVARVEEHDSQALG